MSKVAVVTGAGSGIGRGIAVRLAADGHDVAVLDIDAPGADETVATITAAGGKAVAYECDVADWDAVDGTFAKVRADLGQTVIVVPNAGVSSMVPLQQVDRETWDRFIAVNLTGQFACIQAALPDMIAANWGRIVTISSGSALSGAPNMAHYVASKGGVIALTKALARDLGQYQITANTVAPSLVDTPMAHQEAGGGEAYYDVMAAVVSQIPLGRAGTPADIAGAVSYLVGDDGAYVTGQLLSPNGGLQIW